MSKLKSIKISELKPHPKNPNQHPQEQIQELQNSLAQFDQVKNIVVWSGLIIAGCGLWEAAKIGGRSTIKVQDVSDWPEEKAIAFMVADNRLQELAVVDDDILADLLKNFDDPLNIPGIDEDFLNALNLDDTEEKEKNLTLDPRPFGDERDKMSMKDLLHSVDLVSLAFSGGKDSVGMAIYIYEHYEIPKNKIRLEHYYNPLEWEDIPAYCEYFADRFGIELISHGDEPPDEEKEKLLLYGKRNADNFLTEKIKLYGLPSPMQKWCMERYKQRPAWRIAKRYNKNKINYIQAIGIRAAESFKRAKYLTRGITRDIIPFAHPIFHLSNKETFKLAIKNNIKLHHAYKFFDRTGCPFCPMSSPRSFQILKKEYPKVWDKALELYLLALESDFYRTSTLNRPRADLARFMGISKGKTRKKEWIPPKELTFWHGE